MASEINFSHFIIKKKDEMKKETKKMEGNGPQKIWAIHDGDLTTEENSERFCTTYMYII